MYTLYISSRSGVGLITCSIGGQQAVFKSARSRFVTHPVTWLTKLSGIYSATAWPYLESIDNISNR